jgi:hypothetical protein
MHFRLNDTGQRELENNYNSRQRVGCPDIVILTINGLLSLALV